MMTELWNIYVGIKLAVDLGITNLMVKSDSTCIVDLIENPSIDLYVCSSLIRSIKEIITRFDIFRIRHIFREKNFCADALAKMVVRKSHKSRVMFIPSPVGTTSFGRH
ncbi:hypothetical protein HN873_011470 [Arachis hypogaea]